MSRQPMLQTCSHSIIDVTEVEYSSSEQWRKHIDLGWFVTKLRSALNASNADEFKATAPTGKRQIIPDKPSGSPSQKRIKLSETASLLPIWTHKVEVTLLRDRNHAWEVGVNDSLQSEEADLASASILLGKHAGDELSIGVGYVRCASVARAGIYTTPGTVGSKTGQSECHEKIFCLPLYDDGLGWTLDFPAPLHNLLYAMGIAHGTSRFFLAPVEISARLDDSQRPSEIAKLPVCIALTFNVFINLASIFEPVRDIGLSSAEAQRRILSYVLLPPQFVEEYPGETNIRYFFSCLSPAPSVPLTVNTDALQPRHLQVQLFPFQKRSVLFMLQSEGVTIGSHGEVVPLQPKQNQCPLWEPIDAQWSSEISRVWFHRLSGDIRAAPPLTPSFPGVMLSETMGLGKTVEIIALILLYTPTARNTLPTTWDPELEVGVKPIKASLIVTPPSLIQQWKDEFATRAPTLKVLVYEGRTKLMLPQTAHSPCNSVEETRGQEPEPIPFNQLGEQAVSAWHTLAQEYDIIITTCCVQTLQADLHIARPPNQRPRRAAVGYAVHPRPRSPLILVEFYRVIMDEVQQIGGGNAAEMVSLTKRHVSIAVSGTPARSNVRDLIHVLRFLRVPDLASNKFWTRLISPPFANMFRALFQAISVRTSKKIASSELGLAEQRRFVLPIQLGPVERHNYNERMAEALTALGLDANGIPLSPQWELDVTLLRTSIRRLRQACTHPQIGNATGGVKAVNPRISSIDQVLASMIERNMRQLWELRRTLITEQMTHVLLSQKVEDNATRDKDAVVTLLGIRSDIEQYITDIHNARSEDAHSLGRHTDGNSLDGGASPTTMKSSRPSAEQVVSGDHEHSTSSDSEELSDARDGSQLAQNSPSVSGGHTARLREAKILLHKVQFLLGDAYHRLGCTADEDSSYGAAERIRKQLLHHTEQRALQTMQTLRDRKKRDLGIREQFNILPAENPGKKTAQLFEEANDVISLLNKQAKLLWEWMDDVTNLLTQQFSTTDPADGGEYARALDTQTNAECYVVAIAALLADRRETMNAERTTLASHEYKEVAKRKTQRALDAENDATSTSLSANNPEQVALQLTLTNLRKMVKYEHTSKPLKAVMFDLRKVARDIEGASGPHLPREASIAVAESKRLKAILENQEALLDEVENNMQVLRRAFNDRVAYFRNLQELSDSVEDVTTDENSTLREALETSGTKIAQTQTGIQRGLAKQRYLSHLSDQYNDGSIDEESRCCVLCKCDFSKGFVTECAHVFCQPCLTAWIKKRTEGKSCPICRQGLDATSIHRISVGDPQSKLITVDDLSEPMYNSTLKYRTTDSDTLEEIRSRDSLGQFGSKIQTLVKHLLYLKERQPGSKSICFSAWSDSLAIVSYALETNGITYLRMDGRDKRANPVREFQTDPQYQVLLLHGERDNAGLNVTAARHVFLLEPVVNHTFEVQALARVDRLGGQDTEVYCYYAEDTVEKNILDLSYRRGNSLYTSQLAELDADIVGDRNSKAYGSGRVQKGDFVANTDDMLAIMFPHIYQDIEESELHNAEDNRVFEAGSSVEQAVQYQGT